MEKKNGKGRRRRSEKRSTSDLKILIISGFSRALRTATTTSLLYSFIILSSYHENFEIQTPNTYKISQQ